MRSSSSAAAEAREALLRPQPFLHCEIRSRRGVPSTEGPSDPVMQSSSLSLALIRCQWESAPKDRKNALNDTPHGSVRRAKGTDIAPVPRAEWPLTCCKA
jgi:hypothetical protein